MLRVGTGGCATPSHIAFGAGQRLPGCRHLARGAVLFPVHHDLPAAAWRHLGRAGACIGGTARAPAPTAFAAATVTAVPSNTSRKHSSFWVRLSCSISSCSCDVLAEPAEAACTSAGSDHDRGALLPWAGGVAGASAGVSSRRCGIAMPLGCRGSLEGAPW